MTIKIHDAYLDCDNRLRLCISDEQYANEVIALLSLHAHDLHYLDLICDSSFDHDKPSNKIDVLDFKTLIEDVGSVVEDYSISTITYEDFSDWWHHYLDYVRQECLASKKIADSGSLMFRHSKKEATDALSAIKDCVNKYISSDCTFYRLAAYDPNCQYTDDVFYIYGIQYRMLLRLDRWQ